MDLDGRRRRSRLDSVVVVARASTNGVTTIWRAARDPHSSINHVLMVRFLSYDPHVR